MLWGGAGDDDLLAKAGNDELNGGPGKDHLDGGIGPDDITGGTEFDTVDYSNRTGNLIIDLAKPGDRR